MSANCDEGTALHIKNKTLTRENLPLTSRNESILLVAVNIVKKCTALFVAAALLLVSPLTYLSQPVLAQSAGNTYYVATSGNNANSGTEASPFRTIQYAANIAQAGDTVIVRGGTYAEQVTPSHSGTAASPITFRAYTGELPIIDAGNSIYRNIELIGRSYIVFDGFRVEEPVDSWVRIENSNHITLQNMIFDNPTLRGRAQGGVWMRYSQYNRILNSSFDNWGQYANGDNLGNNIFINNGAEGGYNLIQGNTFAHGANGDVFITSSYNVVRNNVFTNPWQKGLNIQWMTGPGDEPAGTEWPAIGNIAEYNQFNGNGHSEYGHGGYAYTDAAVDTIFRYNTIRNGDYFGINLSTFGDYVFNARNNHYYNNTIVNNGLLRREWLGSGFFATNNGAGWELRNHVVKNNILWGNIPGAGNNPYQLGLDISGATNTPPYAGFTIAGNLIENQRPISCYPTSGDCPFIIVGSSPNTGNASTLNSLTPQFFGNIEGNPQFVQYNTAANQFDLHLTAGSAAIDTGVALTTTTSTGNGVIVPVADSYYFHNGYGITNPDVITVGGETVTIVSINRTTNEIMVDRPIAWTAGAAVNLPFSGSGPDIGAFEFGQVATPTPSPTIVPTPTPTDSPTPTATPTDVPTPSPTVAPTATPTEVPTPTPTVAPTATPTEAPTPTPTIAPTPTLSPTPTPTPTEVPTPTPSPSPTPTEVPTPTPTVAPTPTPTAEPTATPTQSPSPTPTATPAQLAYLSVNTSGTIGGLAVADEDIVTLNPATGQYQMYFDGSDVGLTNTNLDAFSILPNGHILMSFSTEVSIAGHAWPEDIVEFTPTSLGATTAGTFSFYFDGSSQSLYLAAHNIDGVQMLPDGRLLISTVGTFWTMGASGDGKDIAAFTPTSLGSTTTGTWALYFDGTDVSLSGSAEDVNAFWVQSNGVINLSTNGALAVPGVSGQNEDVVSFTPTTLGTTTTGTYVSPLRFDGSNFGLTNYNVDGFMMQ